MSTYGIKVTEINYLVRSNLGGRSGRDNAHSYQVTYIGLTWGWT